MKTIELNGKIVGFVEVPTNASGYKIDANGITFDVKYGLGAVYHDLPEGNWQILSLHREMTEEKASTIMPYNARTKMYKAFGHATTGYWFKAAIESYHSLVKSLGLVTENPYGRTEPNQYEYLTEAQHLYPRDLKQWKEAQKLVKNYVVIYKEK